jgi:hypothetical protein
MVVIIAVSLLARYPIGGSGRPQTRGAPASHFILAGDEATPSSSCCAAKAAEATWVLGEYVFRVGIQKDDQPAARSHAAKRQLLQVMPATMRSCPSLKKHKAGILMEYANVDVPWCAKFIGSYVGRN